MSKAEAAVLDEFEAVENYNNIKEQIAKLVVERDSNIVEQIQESEELDKIWKEAISEPEIIREDGLFEAYRKMTRSKKV